MATRGRFEGWVIVATRALAGLLWLANVHWKVPNDFGEASGGGLYKYVASGAARAPLAPFRWALREVVLPNFRLFGWLTLILETLLTALLLIGYRTRVVALVGAAQAAAIGLSVIYLERNDEWSWSYLLMIGLHLLLWAVAAGEHLGVDGVLASPPATSPTALRTLGVVGAVVGASGLFVARSIGFAGRKVALLGSDAGFARDGQVVRRWELKFLWFNPLWALLTVALAALLIAGATRSKIAWVGVAGFAAMAVVVFATRTFDYVRDDGAIQKVSTGSDAALWAGLALAGALVTQHAARATSPPADE